MTRHFLDLMEITSDELRFLLEHGARLKAADGAGQRQPTLQGRVLGLVFDKPSLRTRVSFETAMAQLGGSSIFMTGQEAGLGSRESVTDVARILSQYVDAIVVRTYRQQTLDSFAEHALCPVINGLTDHSHPCQAVADLLTMQEVYRDLRGRTLVFVGDGNNVARSLAIGCGKVGMHFILAAPEGYGFEDGFRDTLAEQFGEGTIVEESDAGRAVGRADIIYTDVWTSMGQENERESRRARFAAFQVNEQLLASAPAHALVMHCLPAHRGEEVTSEVLDGERSIVVQQAGNRLHAQKALLEWLLVKNLSTDVQRNGASPASRSRGGVHGK